MRVLLVRLDHMGDIVLTVPPVAAALREALPNAQLDVLTTSAGEALLRDDPNINDMMVFDAPWSVPPPGRRSTPRGDYLKRCAAFAARSLWQGRSRYDVILFLSFSPVERLLLWWCGRRCAGFNGPYRRRLFKLSARLLDDTVSFRTDRHVLDNSFDLIRSILPGIRTETYTQLTVSEKRRLRGKRLLDAVAGEARPRVVVHAGTDQSMKSWSLDRYLQVAARLEGRFKANVVLIGTELETEFYRREMKNGGPCPVRLLETPDVGDLVSVVANADLFIGNDGGPAHVAAALGIPTLAVFGPTDENVYGPRGVASRVVRQPGICGRRQYPWKVDSCCQVRNKECLSGIRIETVLKAAESMLGRSKSQQVTRASLG